MSRYSSEEELLGLLDINRIDPRRWKGSARKFKRHPIDKTFYYLAYGSNMLHKRLFQRVGPCKVVNSVRIPGWKLVFDTGTSYCSFANIIQTQDKRDFIEGIVYKLSGWQVNILSDYEGCYDQAFIKHKSKNLLVYIGLEEFKVGGKIIPELNYINLLLDGCVENNLGDTYDLLYNYKIKNYNLKSSRHKKRNF